VNKLHPRAFWLFVAQGLVTFTFISLVFLFPFSWMFTGLVADEALPTVVGLSLGGSVLICLLVFGGLITIWAKLYYNSYKYEFGKEGVKIERGVIWKKYVTIPYGRIQNIDILRGPLARILGLSDLQIQTAGASGAILTEGRIPGVLREEAEEHRNELISRLSGRKEGL